MEFPSGICKFTEAMDKRCKNWSEQEYSFTIRKRKGCSRPELEPGADTLIAFVMLQELYPAAAKAVMRELNIEAGHETEEVVNMLMWTTETFFKAKERRCETCRKYLGGGQCRDNLEKECADGNFEMWEGTHDEPRES